MTFQQETFEHDGSNYEWTVPSRVNFIEADLHGAAGGNSNNGLGARIRVKFDVEENETYYLYPGGQGTLASSAGGGGWNGGGGSGEGNWDAAAGGGGGTDIRFGGTSTSDKIAAAGGGGGGSGRSDGNGGDGGITSGGDGDSGSNAEGGFGATQSSGGDGGDAVGRTGNDGEFYSGGSGGGGSGEYSVGGGGGGGGWYGGGGGGGQTDYLDGDSGDGGGGSSYWVSEVEYINGTTGENDGDGYVVLEYTLAPFPPEDLTGSEVDGNTSLSWTDGEDTNNIEIYRSLSPNVDISGTPLDTVSAGVQEYTDDTVEEGYTYHYKVVGTNEGGPSEENPEISVSIDLPAPTDLTVIGNTDTTVDLEWTMNSSDETGILVNRSLSGGDFEEIADIASASTTYQDTDLLNGRNYEYNVVVYTPEDESSSNNDSVQTNLNDPTDITSDSNERGSIDVEWQSSLNNGEFDIELEDLDTQTTQETTTVDYTTKDISFTEDIDDAIEYEVRIRSSTQDTTGDFQSATVLSFLPRSLISNIEYNTDRNIVITFQKIDNYEDGFFEIYRSEEETQQGNMIRRVPDTRERVVDASIKALNTYYYTVRRVID